MQICTFIHVIFSRQKKVQAAKFVGKMAPNAIVIGKMLN